MLLILGGNATKCNKDMIFRSTEAELTWWDNAERMICMQSSQNILAPKLAALFLSSLILSRSLSLSHSLSLSLSPSLPLSLSLSLSLPLRLSLPHCLSLYRSLTCAGLGASPLFRQGMFSDPAPQHVQRVSLVLSALMTWTFLRSPIPGKQHLTQPILMRTQTWWWSSNKCPAAFNQKHNWDIHL